MAVPARKLLSTLTAVEVEGDGVVVRFAPRRGYPQEVEDRIQVAPRGEMASVYGVGRLLRILRAARIRPPGDPYAWCAEPERAAALLQRCRGVIVDLHVRRRFERVLTIWTEHGVERISGVIDFYETPRGLEVRRRGGRALLRVPRDSLIRYEARTDEYYEVTSIEIPAASM